MVPGQAGLSPAPATVSKKHYLIMFQIMVFLVVMLKDLSLDHEQHKTTRSNDLSSCCFLVIAQVIFIWAVMSSTLNYICIGMFQYVTSASHDTAHYISYPAHQITPSRCSSLEQANNVLISKALKYRIHAKHSTPAQLKR